MSFEISERDGDDDDDDDDSDDVMSAASGGYQSFYFEFKDKVSIKTIMSDSRSIGRMEARIMLAQFRGFNIEQVSNNDPGVLMLDGLPLSELESFIESGGISLETSIRGQNDDILLSVAGNNNNQNKKTLKDLNQILSNFKKATDPSDKDKYRQLFFSTYRDLDPAHKAQIQSQTASQIENTMVLDDGQQEGLLLSVVLPQYSSELNEGINSVVGSTMAGTSTGTFGERYRGNSNVGGGGAFYQQEMRARVASIESQNICNWLKTSCGSQHVWFFIAGIFLSGIFFIQIWVDFAFGEMWRAVLMELLSLLSILICMMEANTDFIRLTIQERLYNHYQFLSTVRGRTLFYLFLCFLAFGKLTIYDSMAIFGGFILMLLTLTRFVLYKWSGTCLDDIIILLKNSQLIRKKFKELDDDNDGYLLMKDMDNLVDANFAKCCCCRSWLKEIIFWRLDSETNDGKIDIHEFVQFCLKFRENVEIQKERRQSRKEQLYRTQTVT